jgi:hypothetical protein
MLHALVCTSYVVVVITWSSLFRMSFCDILTVPTATVPHSWSEELESKPKEKLYVEHRKREAKARPAPAHFYSTCKVQ